jgi:heme exporter protein A
MAAAPLLRIEGLGCERDGRRLFAGLTSRCAAVNAWSCAARTAAANPPCCALWPGLFPDYTGTIEAAESLYLGHRPGISALLTAGENLRWYAALRPGDGDVAAALERVGMAGYERVPCHAMSAGQQRRVGLARLVCCRAPLWLLDEPSDGAGSRGPSWCGG